MAGSIRLTKGERMLIREAITAFPLVTVKDRKTIEGLFAKLDKSEAPRGTGIDVKAAVAAFEGVLGTRLVRPMGAVWGMMQNRIRALGLTEADCASIAAAAGGEWEGRIKAESLVRQAEKLLQSNGAPSTPSRGKRGALDMDDL